MHEIKCKYKKGTSEYVAFFEGIAAHENASLEVVPAQAIAIIELWQSKANLIPCRKVTKEVVKIVTKAIKIHTIEDCADAIDNYSTMLASDYYMNYKWDIKKFFKQGNAAPDFFSDGVKWINYISDKKETSTVSKLSDASPSISEKIRNNTIIILKDYSLKNYKSFSINYTGNDYEMEKKRRFNQVLAMLYPCVFCSLATSSMLYVDEPTKNEINGLNFKQYFDKTILLSNSDKETDRIDTDDYLKQNNIKI